MRIWPFVSLAAALAASAEAAPVGLRSLLIDPGVVASGMGYAYTAVARDPSALYWNPAGLARGAEGTDLLLAHTEWFVDQRLEYAVAVRRRAVDAFAAGISGHYVGGIERRGEDPTSEPLGDFGWYDIAVPIAYARSWGAFRAGAAAKPFYSKIDRVSAHGIALDLGAQWDAPLEGLTLGAAAANIANDPYYVEERFSLPLDFRAGAAYDRPIPTLSGGLLVAAEARKSRDEDAHAHLGAEVRFAEGAAVRFGYKTGYEIEDWSFGVGVSRGSFSVQYALVPYRSDFGNVHRFAFIFHRGD
ncbi:MAG: PorV/PorQ family protein [Candidatus Latescibacterota bacterium]|nr:MAG: PorV/PorQ family protein [Candidatus Latescibacterota bacterium]